MANMVSLLKLEKKLKKPIFGYGRAGPSTVGQNQYLILLAGGKTQMGGHVTHYSSKDSTTTSYAEILL